MDQIKTQLAVVKQHSFWVMCLGILGVTIGSWWYSTGQLRAERDTRKGEIETVTTGVAGIQTQQPQHPNAGTVEGMTRLKLAYAQEVQKGWDLQYRRQEKILVWPENFTEGFRNSVNDKRPIEKIPVTGAGTVRFVDDLPQIYKEEYRNFMEDELPTLAKIIGTEWRAVSAAAGGDASMAGLSGAMPGGMPGAGYGGDASGLAGGTDAYGNPLGSSDPSIVRWDPANQQEILTQHYGFTAPGATKMPTTLEILYAQEDFWVLTNLMHIIAKTNGEATAHHEAAIKYLEFVRLGRSASGLAGQVTMLGMAQGAMAGGMPMDGAMAMPTGDGAAAPDAMATGSADGGMAMPGGGDGYGMSTAMLDPAERRYVDDKYQPLTAARLRTALTSTASEDAMLAVAKRMPVRMCLRIDQRRLNLLIAECGNSALPVEVRQVRINREPAAAGAMGGMMSGGSDGGYGGGMPGGGMGGMPGMGFSTGGSGSSDGGCGGGGGFGAAGGFGGGMPGGMSGDGGYGGGSGMRSVTQDASIDPNLIRVELYGIVYIYNPANKAQLGLEKPPEAPVSPDGTMPTDGAAPSDGTAPTDGTLPAEVAPAADGTTPPAEATPPTAPSGAEVTTVAPPG